MEVIKYRLLSPDAMQRKVSIPLLLRIILTLNLKLRIL